MSIGILLPPSAMSSSPITCLSAHAAKTLLFLHAWTTASLLYMASPTIYCDDYKPYRTMQHAYHQHSKAPAHHSSFATAALVANSSASRIKVYKVLNNLAPQCLIDDCQLVATTSRRHQLRSSDNLNVPLSAQTHVSAIAPSHLPDHDSVTVCQYTFANLP